MQFEKHQMIGSLYNWNKDGQSSYSGEPTRRLFDRFNGNQVLFIINYYGTIEGNGFSVDKAQMIEKMIAEQLPLDAKSEISVFNWITEEMTAPQSNIVS